MNDKYGGSFNSHCSVSVVHCMYVWWLWLALS